MTTMSTEPQNARTGEVVQAQVNTKVQSRPSFGRVNGGFVLQHNSLLYCIGGLGLTILSEDYEVLCKVKTGVLTASGAGALCINGTLCYTLGGKGLAIFDVSDPTNPKKLSQFSTGVMRSSNAASLCFTGKCLYVVGGGGLAVIDVTDPAKPFRISKQNTGVCTGARGGEIMLQGKHLYVSGRRGLAVFSMKTPESPERVGLWYTGNFPQDSPQTLALNGDVAYQLYFDSVAVIDIRDPRKPHMVRKVKSEVLYPTAGGSMLLDPSRKLLYVAGEGGLSVLNIARPFRPEVQVNAFQTGVITLNHRPHMCFLPGTLAAVIGGHGLAVLDLSQLDKTP